MTIANLHQGKKMPPKKIIQSDTDHRIPVARDWEQALLNYIHDGTRVMNSVILVFGLFISPFIIFSSAVKNQTEWIPFEIGMIGLKTTLPGAFILYLGTIIVCVGIVQSNMIFKIFYEWVKRKIND